MRSSPAREGVVAEQGLDSQAVGLSDGEERIAGADHIGALRVLDYDGLSHHQPGGVRELIVLQQTGHGHAVGKGDGVQGIARFDNMDIHRNLLASVQRHEAVFGVANGAVIVDQIPVLPLVDDGEERTVRGLGQNGGVQGGAAADIEGAPVHVHHAGAGGDRTQEGQFRRTQ